MNQKILLCLPSLIHYNARQVYKHFLFTTQFSYVVTQKFLYHVPHTDSSITAWFHCYKTIYNIMTFHKNAKVFSTWVRTSNCPTMCWRVLVSPISSNCTCCFWINSAVPASWAFCLTGKSPESIPSCWRMRDATKVMKQKTCHSHDIHIWIGTNMCIEA